MPLIYKMYNSSHCPKLNQKVAIVNVQNAFVANLHARQTEKTNYM